MSLITIGRAALGAALAAGCLLGASAQAATDVSVLNLTGIEYDTAGVVISGDLSFQATADDGNGNDSVVLQIYDDLVLKASQTFEALVGTQTTAHFEFRYAGRVGTDSPGVGLGVIDIPDMSQYAFVVEPFMLGRAPDPCTANCGPVPAVPEPSEYALMLVGLAGVAAATRRRTQRAATAR